MNVFAYLSHLEHIFDEGILFKDLTESLQLKWDQVAGFSSHGDSGP
jgi:hypothetical protein